jgi:hypothetical protein
LQFIFETNSFFYFEIFKKLELQLFINSNNSPTLLRTSVGELLDPTSLGLCYKLGFRIFPNLSFPSFVGIAIGT